MTEFDNQLLQQVKTLNETKILKEWNELFENIKKTYAITGKNLKLRIPLNKKTHMILGSNFPVWLYKEIGSGEIKEGLNGYKFDPYFDYEPFYIGEESLKHNPDKNPDYEMISLFLKYKNEIYEELNYMMSSYLEEMQKQK